MRLSSEVFRTVVAATPLISIDLVVQNTLGQVLLGWRSNRPAEGCWFVPGGRVLKNETLDVAFLRISLSELGHGFARHQARFLGVYEHFYIDSVFGQAQGDPNTHYVALGHRILLPAGQKLPLPLGQHEAWRWWTITDILVCADVHDNTRAYLAALD